MKKSTRRWLYGGGAGLLLFSGGIATEVRGPKEGASPEDAAPIGISQSGGEVQAGASMSPAGAKLLCTGVVGLAKPEQSGGDDLPVEFLPNLKKADKLDTLIDAADVTAVFTTTNPDGAPVGDSETYKGNNGRVLVYMLGLSGRLALSGTSVDGDPFACPMVDVATAIADDSGDLVVSVEPREPVPGAEAIPSFASGAPAPDPAHS